VPRYYTLCMLFLLNACASETNKVTESVLSSSVKLDNNQFVTTSSLGGVLKAPVGIVATGGGNLVATGGGNLVATGGGNLVARFGLLAINEVPVVSASITLTNLKREPLPGITTVVTDSNGNFRFDRVPRGETLLMTTTLKTGDGKTCYFQGLARAGTGLEVVDINSAGTIVSTWLLSRLKAVEAKDLGSLDMSLFREVTAFVANGLASDKLPDFSSESALVKQMETLEGASAGIRRLMVRLEEALAPKREKFAPPAGAADVPGTPASLPSAPSGVEPAPGAPSDAPPSAPAPGSNLVGVYEFPPFEGLTAECSAEELGKQQLSVTTIEFLPDLVTNKEFVVDEMQICRYEISKSAELNSFIPIEGSVLGFDAASKKWKVKLPLACSIVLVIRSGTDVFAKENVNFTTALSFRRTDFRITGTKKASPSPKP
jgi:hypothetical protein